MGYEALWLSVLNQARLDAREWHPPRRLDAVRWFHDPTIEPGSFRWICRHVGLDPTQTIRNIDAKLVEPTKADWQQFHMLDRRRNRDRKFLTGEEAARILSGEEGSDERG